MIVSRLAIKLDEYFELWGLFRFKKIKDKNIVYTKGNDSCKDDIDELGLRWVRKSGLEQ